MPKGQDRKSRLAKRGVELVDAAAPEAIKERLSETARNAATGAVLDVIECISGGPESVGPDSLAGARAERKVSSALSAMDSAGKESFDRRLAAAARSPRPDLRKSFPEESKELAVLVFSCVELIELLERHAAQGTRPPAADLERKEKLLTRVAALLAPHAGEALQSFVAHVVAESRGARGRG